ncbi:hypothetical protein PI125_g19032 [Phytophthora idaei]|nr:hypothetical protein PI125_g19032 [Phytophthora idaei]KAG3139376.1 hypothetical protein PI126_g16480 [Phytophthora idaei]
MVTQQRGDDTDLASDEESRIYGGANADINKYPSVAAVLAEGTDGKLLCGGMPIAPQYVHRDRKSGKVEKILVLEVFRHLLYNSGR